MDGPWLADRTAISRPGRTPGDLGAGVRPRRTDGYASAAQGPQRWRLAVDQLPEPGRRRHAVANPDLGSRLGLLPGLRRAVCRSGAGSLGFGARLVSGYLFNPDQMLVGSTDAGSTHAWGEVFVSGAGWISFDPTNRSVGGANLIPVAVARDIRQAAPVSGTYAGNSDALEGMAVKVLVTSTAAPAQRQGSEHSSSVGLAFSGADRFSP